jgi:hypothetical protein
VTNQLHNIPGKEIVPVRHYFSGTTVCSKWSFTILATASGISDGAIPDQPSALDILKFFFSTKIMQEITAETNKYYIFVRERMPASPCSRVQKWRDTTPEELYVFFAVTVLMVRVKKTNNIRLLVG